MEEYYGSLVIGIMMFVAVLVSGVLSASFYNKSIYGSSPIIFMLVILDLFINFKLKVTEAIAQDPAEAARLLTTYIRE